MYDPTKAELIEAMVSARGRFDALISQIPHAKMVLAGACGEWSVKDVVAHITCCDRWLVLTLALRCQKPPDFWLEDTPLDASNRRLYDENRDLPLDQVLQESADVWGEILEATRAQSETYLFSEQSVPGVPNAFRPCDVLKSESCGHYLDHVPALLAFVRTLEQPK